MQLPKRIFVYGEGLVDTELFAELRADQFNEEGFMNVKAEHVKTELLGYFTNAPDTQDSTLISALTNTEGYPVINGVTCLIRRKLAGEVKKERLE